MPTVGPKNLQGIARQTQNAAVPAVAAASYITGTTAKTVFANPGYPYRVLDAWAARSTAGGNADTIITLRTISGVATVVTLEIANSTGLLRTMADAASVLPRGPIDVQADGLEIVQSGTSTNGVGTVYVMYQRL